MIHRYRKKPDTIQAIQFMEDEYHDNKEIYSSFDVQDKAVLSEIWHNTNANDGRYFVGTFVHSWNLSDGDYIIKDEEGCYPVSYEKFSEMYEKVKENNPNQVLDDIAKRLFNSTKTSEEIIASLKGEVTIPLEDLRKKHK